MLDIGFWEMAVIAVVALVVVQPEDFPAFLHRIGATVSKMRGLAGEFRTSVAEAVTDVEALNDLPRTIGSNTEARIDSQYTQHYGHTTTLSDNDIHGFADASPSSESHAGDHYEEPPSQGVEMQQSKDDVAESVDEVSLNPSKDTVGDLVDQDCTDAKVGKKSSGDKTDLTCAEPQ